MKIRKNRISAFCFFAALLCISEGCFGVSLDIDGAITLAVSRNRSVQIQELELGFAKANISYARSFFMPQVEAGFGYTYNDSVVMADETPGKRKDIRMFYGYKNDNQFSVNAAETIYNGGADIANYNEAKLQLKAQEETLRSTKLEIEYETKRLFYGVLLAVETKRISEQLVRQAQAHYEEVDANFKEGTASKFDVLQSRVQVSRVFPQLVNADNSIQLQTVELKKLLDIKLTEEVEISGALDTEYIDLKEEEFLSKAFANNPDIIAKLLGIKINKWAVEYAKAGWYPQITASFAYNYRSNDIGNMFNSRHDNWNMGVKASMNLFDGFETKAKVDMAKARYKEAKVSSDDVIDQVAVDIKNACLNMKEAKTVIDYEKESIDEAREALRLSEVRFNNGVGTNLDVFDSEVALAEVQQNLAQGVYDYIMAKAMLDKTIGLENTTLK